MSHALLQIVRYTNPHLSLMYSLSPSACGWILTAVAIVVLPISFLHVFYNTEAESFSAVSSTAVIHLI